MFDSGSVIVAASDSWASDTRNSHDDGNTRSHTKEVTRDHQRLSMGPSVYKAPVAQRIVCFSTFGPLIFLPQSGSERKTLSP